MKVGYIRVSTEEQNTERQEALMRELGAEKVFIEGNGQDPEGQDTVGSYAPVRPGRGCGGGRVHLLHRPQYKRPA